jgi:hypothetical protein
MRPGLSGTLPLTIIIAVLLCIPQISLAGSGHGGGLHGGGGFHGSVGWHGYGAYGLYRPGWRVWGYPGWGYGWRYPGWRYGWGWGVSIGVGWGWYGPSYPYAYQYPYYYYNYYPYYPYCGPCGCAPQVPGRYNGSIENSPNNPPRQNYSAPAPEDPPHAGIVTVKATTLTNSGTIGSGRVLLRQQVRNVIQAFQAMPPDARRRQIESGLYRTFTPEEQDLLRNVAQLPAPPEKTR